MLVNRVAYWILITIFCFTLFCIQQKPITPINVIVKETSASHVTLEWDNDSAHENGFRIEQQKNEEWIPLGYTDADQTQFIVAGLLANTKCRFRIVAFNDQGEMESNIVYAETTDKYSERQSRLIEDHSARQGESTFIKLKNGDMVLFYSDMETVSDLAEATVSKKVSTDNGKTWSERRIVFQEKGMSLFLPGVIRLDNGNIGISYARRVPGDWFAKRVFRFSANEGKTWSEEIPVSDDRYDYSTGSHDRLYRLSNDRLVLLVHSITTPGGERPHHLVTDVYVSDDHGLSWDKTTDTSLDVPINPFDKGEYGLWECSIVETKPGHLLMFGRTATAWLHKCESTDYGDSWTTPAKVGIPHPLTPPYLKKIPDTQTIVFLNNPIVEKDHRLLGNRYVLASRISDDGGKTWKNYKEIEYHSHDWWYDYPCMLFDGDIVHISMRDIKLTPKNRWDKVYLGYLQLERDWFLK